MIRLYNQNVWGNMSKGNEIANRNQLIRSLVQDYQADVCTFQECNPTTTRRVADALQLLLSDVYAEACSQDAEHNFTPVFYRKDKYREIESGFHPYEGNLYRL